MSAFFSYLFFKIPVVLHTNTTTITIKVEELRKVNDCNNTHISMRYGVIAFGSNPRSCRRNSWLQSFQEGLHLWSRRWSMCFFFKESIPCTRLDQCDQPDCESMWISLRTHSLSRPMSSIILRVVYRSTADVQPENVALCDHIGMNLDQLLWHQANSLVIVVRDVNSTSTGLRLNDLRRPNNLKQKVYFKTRDLGTSDCFLNNKPKVFGLSQLPNLATADHYVTLTT